MRTCLIDMECVQIRDLVPLVEVNTTAACEHVGVVERKIRHVKEKAQATTSEYPFEWIPVMVLIYTVYFCVFWLNVFPKHSENFGFSPREIVTGLTTDYKRDRKVDPGSWLICGGQHRCDSHK